MEQRHGVSRLVSRSPLFLLCALQAVREGLADLIVRAAGITRRVSNETQHHVDGRVAAIAPLPDASHYGRHRSWDIEGREFQHGAGGARGLAVRDAGALR